MFVKSSEKEVLGVKYKHDLRCFEPRLFGAMTSLTFASGVFLYWNVAVRFETRSALVRRACRGCVLIRRQQ